MKVEIKFQGTKNKIIITKEGADKESLLERAISYLKDSNITAKNQINYEKE